MDKVQSVLNVEGEEDSKKGRAGSTKRAELRKELREKAWRRTAES